MTVPLRLRLEPLDLVCVAALFVSMAVAFPTSADPDLWGHVRFGQHAVTTRALPRVDPFSFTSDQDWINHEWLAEVAMAAAFDAFGATGLIVFKGGLIVLAMGLATRTLWTPGLGGPRALATLLFVGLAGVYPLTATFRPQVFSVVLMAAELAVLLAAPARPSVLWVLPPLFALWANLHGGWLVGCGMLGLWVAARIAFCDTGPSVGRGYVAVVAASVFATLLTPYGFALWTFLWETVGLTRPDIPEWWSLVQHHAIVVPWTITCVLGGWATKRGGREGWPAAAVAFALAVLSARVARVTPFFCLSVGMGLLPIALRNGVRAERGRATVGVYPAIVLTGALLAAGQNLTQAPERTCLQPNSAITLDSRAAGFIGANRLQGRLMVWFDWGEYAIWHFGPSLLVSIDGRRETVYSQRTLARHLAFYSGSREARPFLDELAPDYIWIPQALPVSPKLDSWGYRRIFETEQSAVWAPVNDRRDYAGPGPATPNCFPGPAG